jgi:hypothetical protein
VSGAGWTPSYDARVTYDSDVVEISYYGNIVNSSGEDWEDVRNGKKLKFSDTMPRFFFFSDEFFFVDPSLGITGTFYGNPFRRGYFFFLSSDKFSVFAFKNSVPKLTRNSRKAANPLWNHRGLQTTCRTHPPFVQ